MRFGHVQTEKSMRQRLPNRRPAITHTLEYNGERYHVSIGYDMYAEPKEVFIRGSKTGSDMDHLLDDAAVVVSVALQNGVKVAEMRRSLGDSLVNNVLALVDAP